MSNSPLIPLVISTLDSVTDAGATTTNALTLGGLHVDSTGAVELPVGTELQRPSAVTGMLRFNSDASSFEGYDGVEWGSIGGGGFANIYQNSPYTAVSNDYVYADTSSASFTVTLPATPAAGDIVVIGDYSSTFSANPLIAARNGSTIEGNSADLVLSISNIEYTLIYLNNDWKVFGVKKIPKFKSERYISGPGSANERQILSLKIEEWSSYDVYNISVSAGSFIQTSDTISWTLPNLTINAFHTLTLQLVGGNTFIYTVYVVNIPMDVDNSISITDFSSNSYNDGWTTT